MKHTFTLDSFQCVYDGVLTECTSVSNADMDHVFLTFEARGGGQVVLKMKRSKLMRLAEDIQAFLKR